jgi:hypothetical protein
MPTSLPAVDAPTPAADRADHADTQDARVCAAFAVTIIVGSWWFYENVLCFALHLTR